MWVLLYILYYKLLISNLVYSCGINRIHNFKFIFVTNNSLIIFYLDINLMNLTQSVTHQHKHWYHDSNILTLWFDAALQVVRHVFFGKLSLMIGWTYFLCWSLSYYPQIVQNWRRRSVVGLSFDWLSLNMSGHICYCLFNVAMCYNSAIRVSFRIGSLYILYGSFFVNWIYIIYNLYFIWDFSLNFD